MSTECRAVSIRSANRTVRHTRLRRWVSTTVWPSGQRRKGQVANAETDHSRSLCRACHAVVRQKQDAVIGTLARASASSSSARSASASSQRSSLCRHS